MKINGLTRIFHKQYELRSSNFRPLAKSSLRPVLLKLSHTHLFTCYLWLLSYGNDRIESLQQGPCDPQSLKCLLLDLYRIIDQPLIPINASTKNDYIIWKVLPQTYVYMNPCACGWSARRAWRMEESLLLGGGVEGDTEKVIFGLSLKDWAEFSKCKGRTCRHDMLWPQLMILAYARQGAKEWWKLPEVRQARKSFAHLPFSSQNL